MAGACLSKGFLTISIGQCFFANLFAIELAKNHAVWTLFDCMSGQHPPTHPIFFAGIHDMFFSRLPCHRDEVSQPDQQPDQPLQQSLPSSELQPHTSFAPEGFAFSFKVSFQPARPAESKPLPVVVEPTLLAAQGGIFSLFFILGCACAWVHAFCLTCVMCFAVPFYLGAWSASHETAMGQFVLMLPHSPKHGFCGGGSSCPSFGS